VCIGVCIENQKMKITDCSWISTTLKLLFVAALPTQAWAYKILVLPTYVKSHVFGMSTLAVGLANRGHKVALFLGENCPLDLPEIRNRTEISVVRYKDATDGVYKDYDATDESFVKEMLQSGGDVMHLVSSVSTAYVVRRSKVW